jgi:hypothetical protein
MQLLSFRASLSQARLERLFRDEITPDVLQAKTSRIEDQVKLKAS